ncbi:hypothetical protein [Kribbella sp. NPDC055071]
MDVDKTVDVEIDVHRSYDARSFEKVAECSRGFSVESETLTVVCGIVTEVDFQDVLTLAVGESSLRFDVEGDVPMGIEGATVRVVVDDLEIYPTGV